MAGHELSISLGFNGLRETCPVFIQRTGLNRREIRPVFQHDRHRWKD